MICHFLLCSSLEACVSCVVVEEAFANARKGVLIFISSKMLSEAQLVEEISKGRQNVSSPMNAEVFSDSLSTTCVDWMT